MNAFAQVDALERGNAPTGARVVIDVREKTFAAVADRSAQTVLRNVSLDIAPRSFAVITGPSGCGKSTLLNIVADLDRAYVGEVHIGGSTPRLGFIFQSPRLLPWRTVYDNIALPLPEDDPRRAAIPEFLARVGLSGAETAFPERLSLGMQRRVAIARGFILQPDVLLMDEPFVSLDDPTAQALRVLVMELWHQHPTTILFVTHDRKEAVQLGTRVIRLAALSGNPSLNSVVADAPVVLTADERADPDALRAAQARIFDGVQ